MVDAARVILGLESEPPRPILWSLILTNVLRDGINHDGHVYHGAYKLLTYNC